MPTTKTKTKTLESVLNKQVANMTVMYMKLHHYHWFVKGNAFFSIHPKLEELYNEMTMQMDQLAERMLALRFEPISTLKECLEEASLEEARGKESSKDMVEQLIDDYTMMCDEIDEAITLAEEKEDKGTADMLTEFKTAMEKNLWMLRAFATE